ncbi:hypothetical protein MXB_3081, partial [Myxobolus squamalis]
MNNSKEKNGIGSKENIQEKTENSSNHEINYNSVPVKLNECPICHIQGGDSIFYCMTQCKHRICILCFLNNLLGISTCGKTANPEYACCREHILPIDATNMVKQIKENKITIKNTIAEPHSLEPEYLNQFLSNYEDIYFSLIPYIQALPGIVVCPDKHCNFPVVTFGATWKCLKVTCKNKQCGLVFCSNCKCTWGKNKECKKNNEFRLKLFQKSSSTVFMKNCPFCASPVCRNVDSFSNYVECTTCHTKLCFLCSKRADIFHFIITKNTCIALLVLMAFFPIILLIVVLILTPSLLFCIPRELFST